MKTKINFWSSFIFIIIMLGLYISFLFFGKNLPVAKIEYAGIVLCFLFSFLIFKIKKDTWLVRFALLFTVISDWFLVIKQSEYILALVTFTIAQLFYAVRLWENDDSIYRNFKHIFSRILFLIILGTLFGYLFIKFDVGFDLLVVMAVLYFSFLVMNVILSFIQIQKNILFPIGLVLFLCCDILVSLSKIENYITLSESSILFNIIHCPVDLIWVFYFPSQVLLALSILTNKTNEI